MVRSEFNHPPKLTPGFFVVKIVESFVTGSAKRVELCAIGLRLDCRAGEKNEERLGQAFH
jgi:hypothetical protein